MLPISLRAKRLAARRWTAWFGFPFLLHEPYLRDQLLSHVKERGERVPPLSEVIFPGFGCQDAARCDDVEPGMRLLGQREFRRECAG